MSLESFKFLKKEEETKKRHYNFQFSMEYSQKRRSYLSEKTQTKKLFPVVK